MACVSELQRRVVPRPGRQRKAQLLYHKRVLLRLLLCQPANIIAWLAILETAKMNTGARVVDIATPQVQLACACLRSVRYMIASCAASAV